MVYGLRLDNRSDLDKAHKALRRFQIRFMGLDYTHSVAFRFMDCFDALRGLEALKWMKIKAKLIFHIL